MSRATERDVTVFEANGALLRGAPLRGSLSAVPIAQAAAADTLLTYSIAADPSPPLVGGTVTLTLVVSNPTRQAITCTQIDVTLPVGESGKELTADATGIDTSPPDDWDVKRAGNVFTLTPTGDAGRIGGEGLAFVFSRIKVNDEPGRAQIRITETASSPAAPSPTARRTTIAVDKFPQKFSLSDLRVLVPPSLDVPNGGTATLMWNGSESATYTLRYQPADSGTPVEVSSPEIGGSGPYVTRPLTRSDSVMFTLTALVKVPGQDQPVAVQRLAFVTVQTVSLTFVVLPPAVGVNGLVRVRWSAPNAEYCLLDDGTRLESAGDICLVLAKSRDFTITAYNARGTPLKQLQSKVTVDPTIVAGPQGPSYTGKVGGNGSAAQCPRTYAGKGGKGEDAIWRQPLPPLDVSTKPKRVIPIRLTGGPGGNGGAGTGCNNPRYPRESWGLMGGDGGDGGDAGIDTVFDSAAGEPAQYVVYLQPGSGGTAGARPQHMKIDDGKPGKPGSTFIRIRDPG